MNIQNNSRLESALKYIERGYKIFPCVMGEKKPLTKNGVKDATSDKGQIIKWWTDTPNANIGLATGSVNEIIVIDIDERHNGEDSLQELEKELGKLPETITSLTGGGGFHYLFKLPEGITIKNAVRFNGRDGIDIRGEGGYIVVPNSLHPSGKEYIWDLGLHFEDFPMAELPQEWIKALTVRKEDSRVSNDSHLVSNKESNLLQPTVYGNPKGWMVEALKNLKEGNRHMTFFKIGCRLKDYMAQDELLALLSSHAEKVGFTRDNELEKLVQDIYQRYPQKQILQIKDGLELLHLHDRAEPEPLPYIVEKFVPKGFITLIHGSGAAGKSTFALAMASHIALGLPFFDLPVTKSRVAFLDFELNEDCHTRRSYAISRGINFNTPPEGLYYARPNQPLSRLLDQIEKVIDQYGIEVIIIDSVGPAAGIDPESGNDVISLMQNLLQLGVTIILIDHEAKPQGSSKAPRSPFGSVYKTNLARSVFQMTRVDSSETSSTISLKCTKSNFDATGFQLGYKASFDKSLDDKLIIRITKEDLTNPVFAEAIIGKDKVLNALEELGEADRTALAEMTGLAKDTVTNILTRLKEAREVHVVGKKGNAPIYSLHKPKENEEQP